ncbi:MAG: DUF3800 domain-containing protein [Actinobacteria bacterium]|nr:DUF3800 domain-containing protein [Actinomycetota bacterium]
MAQPLYAVASVVDHAGLSELIPSETETEWKWSVLASSNQGQDAVMSIAEKVSPSTVKIAIADKRFMAVAKMVDELIEPLALETGFDFYGTNSHIGLTQMVYVALRGLAGVERFNEVVRLFVRMMRRRTGGDIDAFFSEIDEVGNLSDRLNEQLSLFLAAEHVVAPKILSARPGSYELDPSVPLVASLSQAWTLELGVPHRFVHDDAGVLEKWKPHLERMANPEIEPRRIKFGDKEVVLPVLTFELTFEDSETRPGIQIADVLAGATRYMAQAALTGEQTDFSLRLNNTPLANCVAEALWFVPPDSPVS